MDKVNQALSMFGMEAVPGKKDDWWKHTEQRMYMWTTLPEFLKEKDFGYLFVYDSDYLESENPTAVSLTLPLQKENTHQK